MNLRDYELLLPYYFMQKPKFRGYYDTLIQNWLDIKAFMYTMQQGLDIDTATGVNLDLCGEIVGRSRYVTPIINWKYFSWDIIGLGWDEADWGPYEEDIGPNMMDDHLYRQFIKFYAALSQWDGTIPELYNVFDVAFGSDISVKIINNQDMSIQINITFNTDDLPVRFAILQGLLPINITGVNIIWTGDLPNA